MPENNEEVDLPFTVVGQGRQGETIDVLVGDSDALGIAIVDPQGNWSTMIVQAPSGRQQLIAQSGTQQDQITIEISDGNTGNMFVGGGRELCQVLSWHRTLPSISLFFWLFMLLSILSCRGHRAIGKIFSCLRKISSKRQ